MGYQTGSAAVLVQKGGSKIIQTQKSMSFLNLCGFANWFEDGIVLAEYLFIIGPKVPPLFDEIWAQAEIC